MVDIYEKVNYSERMEWLNYHHLRYFWTVAREESILRACEKLLVSQPTENTALRQVMEQWFQAAAIRPAAVAEFEDSALLNVFGEAGLGLFPAPAVIEREVQRQYGVRIAGRIESARTQFYAISTERKLRHPAVRAISEAAKGRLFGGTS